MCIPIIKSTGRRGAGRQSRRDRSFTGEMDRAFRLPSWTDDYDKASVEGTTTFDILGAVK